MFYYVYILQSFRNNSFYIGYTSNLKERVRGHNAGKSLATKPYIPYKLIFYEAFRNRIDAKNREEYLKSGYGRKSIKILLEKYLKSGIGTFNPPVSGLLRSPGRAFIRKHKLID